MNTSKETYVAIGVVVAVLALIVGGYYFPQSESKTVVQQVGVGSATGSTFNTAKIGEVVMAPTSASATSTSIYNGDASDRIVLDAGVSCSGLTSMYGLTSSGLATFQWVAATTSAAAPGTSVIPSALAAMNVTVATSSPVGYTATSTYTSNYARIWNSGSYMTFQTNGTSSAASCLPFLHYIGS